MENVDLATAVQALKAQSGKDILVYGGVSFVSSLIELNLIDEYYLIINPITIGRGLPVFRERKVLALQSTTAYTNGKVLHKICTRITNSLSDRVTFFFVGHDASSTNFLLNTTINPKLDGLLLSSHPRQRKFGCS